MKIAVPTRENVVNDHFGHCEAYTIFSIDETKNITSFERIPSPQGCGCKSDIAGILQKKGVTVMLAGNMGDGALNVLGLHGIEIYRGCSGDVQQLVEAFLQGKIKDSEEGCHHHGHKEENIWHQCHNH